MGESLYSIFKPLVDGNQTGMLQIAHADGDQAIVRFTMGEISGIRLGDVTGMLAGKALSMWLRFSATPGDQDQPMGDDVAGLDTPQYMALLSKIAMQTEKMQAKVTVNCVVWKVASFKMPATKAFKPEEIKFLLAVDGQSTIDALARRLKIPEFLALHYAYRFQGLGLVKKINASNPLGSKATASFLSSLTTFLAEQVGPAAEIIVNKAFEFLESEPQLIFKSEFPELIGAISNHLEDDDDIAFKKWALDSWQSY